jgi:hypothetical protein
MSHKSAKETTTCPLAGDYMINDCWQGKKLAQALGKGARQNNNFLTFYSWRSRFGSLDKASNPQMDAKRT